MTKMLFWGLCVVMAGGMMTDAKAAPRGVCGVFQDEARNATARIVSANRMEMRYKDAHIAPRFFLYQRSGNTLKAENLDAVYGDPLEFTLSGDGRVLRYSNMFDGEIRLQRNERLDCGAEDVATNPAGRACRQDIGVCKEKSRQASQEDLEALCADHLPFACLMLIERYEDAANATEGEEVPAVCREGDPAFDVTACETAVAQAIAVSFAKILSSDAAKPLAAGTLDRLPALCVENASSALCQEVAEKLWDGGRYLDAAKSLRHACAAPIDDASVCAGAEALAALDAGALAQPATEILPCGHYLAATGLISELTFTDNGNVGVGLGVTLRARLENGLVRIRHERGGDFVLRRLADGRLLGLDSFNRYALYSRDGGQERCAAPARYREAELKADCHAGESMAACCERGGVQGCNGMGHSAALAGDWDGALEFYQRVCAADVRSGCENMTKIGTEAAKAALESLCAKDAEAVACDVAELANWALLGTNRALQDALQSIEAEAASE
ncbi:MAG: hypothetical protein LBF93_01375 [Zoogloeaceae bacterium]|nr:hypothetical protein [Zoogloeaceae bacterium]